MRNKARAGFLRQYRGMVGLTKGVCASLAVLVAVVGVLSGCGTGDSAASKSSELSAAMPSAQQANGSASAEKADKATAASDAKASSNTAAGGSFTGETAPEATDPFSRKIIYKANLVMQVEKYQDTAAKVQEAVRQSGAYILQFSENMAAAEKGGTFIIKVPANGFQSLLTMLEQINPTMQKNMQGQDVTEEYVDLSSRLKAKQVVEERLISFMEKATKTDELVAFSSELGKVQEEIERIKGRMRYLEQNVAYSTIELRLTQKIGSAEVIGSKDRGPLLNRAVAALNGSVTVLSVMFQWFVVFAAGALPIIALLIIIGVPLWFVRGKRKAKLADIRKQLAEHNKLPETTEATPKELE
ncbi:DUF4349 domain-containing protein [Paenibacillus allorhizosphaerae]|uniref:DUF4349 domain-containing protein n=1 Tax=Paenibacillus allorhizosphaerae TaxID=2849866 RepID=A0ABN7TGT9_9BACL|nr:DUF4349 domain-containing protein [Paenibacillus allorhizosphaerae]CAG7620658.1 hypothetical protein PAECIP111802_00682 [Paenibacillus allorhizosphaerae]